MHWLGDRRGVPDGAIDRTEIATYTSLFEFGNDVCFWYPDRKHFLLGRYLTDELLAELTVPEA